MARAMEGGQGECPAHRGRDAQGGEGRDFRRPWLRLSVSAPLLLACALCALAALSAGGGSGSRQVELLSAIDEYLQGKYGMGESQSLGQLNKFDSAGYAGTQSVAKEFGLSDNNPLVQQWNQDNTLDSLDENPLQGLRAESVPDRAAAITQSVFGGPAPAAPARASPVDARQAAMQARGAKAVQSQSIAAERKEMRQQMLQKFETQAEATTKRVAAQAVDTIGDGTVPSDTSFLPMPAAAAGVPALAAAAKAAVKPAQTAAAASKAAATPAAGKAPAKAAAVGTGGAVKGTTTATSKAGDKQAVTPAAPVKPVTAEAGKVPVTAASAPKRVKSAGKKDASVSKKTSVQAKQAKESYKARLRAQIKALEKEVQQSHAGKHHGQSKVKAAVAQPPPQSWSGLANMLSTRTAAEEQAAREQKRLLAQESAAASSDKLMSDPEDDLHFDENPDGPTDETSVDGASFGSLLTTLKKDEDPEAAAQENMYRDAEQQAISTLHPVQEVYTETPQDTSEQPALQQQGSTHLQQLHHAPSPLSAKLTAVENSNTKTALKLQLLHDEVLRLKQRRQVQKLEQEVVELKHPQKKQEKPLTSLAATRLPHRSQEAKYLAEDEKKIKLAERHHAASAASKVSQQKSVLAAKADAKFEAAREHMAAKQADTSEEDVARLRAEVSVMRDRITTLEKDVHAKAGGAQDPVAAAATSAAELKGKAREQLLQQLRLGALQAGKASGEFWKKRTAQMVAAKYKAEALSAGAKSYDQVAACFRAGACACVNLPRLHARPGTPSPATDRLHYATNGEQVQELKMALARQMRMTQELEDKVREGGAGPRKSSAVPGASGASWVQAARGGGDASRFAPAAGGAWARGLAQVRREMRGVREDMDETAGKEDGIVARISDLGRKIGGFLSAIK